MFYKQRNNKSITDIQVNQLFHSHVKKKVL